jgi:DNA-binding transcriptional ArsR family regulator
VTEEPLGAAFNALADPTRRQLVGMIAERGSVTASEMAREFPITRQAVAKHLAVLQEAGLAEPARNGRETRYALRRQGLVDAAAWISEVGADWDARLGRLERHASDPDRRSP